MDQNGIASPYFFEGPEDGLITDLEDLLAKVIAKDCGKIELIETLNLIITRAENGWYDDEL